MKKIEKVYSEILKRQIVNNDDLYEIISLVFKKPIDYKYFYSQYLLKLIREKKLTRVRKGLYHGIDIYSNTKSTPDKYLIGAKLRKKYYLGYHTALELHGCAYSSYNRCYIVTDPDSKFESFSFNNLSFQPVLQNDIENFVEKIRYSDKNINVSNPSRTFLECLDRPDLCGGWEEVLKSLDSLGNVKFNEIKKLLKISKKQILYRKCGYVLDILMEHSPYYAHIKEKKGLPRIAKNSTKLFIEKNNRGEYIQKWKLYAPFDFTEIIRGV